ncbi:hypothetical protein [Dyella amyloliquefaciens]|uniref:hypothetical protein n=1 Tax=Dyella amyloliquefaciens TaxID=1770545 RepID=UPI00197AAD1E|nr:hypothetical protein [Dyella amyloliquefaciens]
MATHAVPDFVAEICLLPGELGDFHSHLSGGEWQTVLEINHEFWSATMHFDGEHLPGELFEAEVWLLLADVALPMFGQGASFAIWEDGSHAFGSVKRLTHGSDLESPIAQREVSVGAGVMRAGAGA